MRVLIVDDDDALRTSLVRQLEPLGYDVTEAATGDEAYWQYKQHNFDFVLTDFMFMGSPTIRDGVQLLKKIEELNPFQPVAMMTSAPRELRQELGRRRLTILRKPFAIERLLRLLTQYALPLL